MNDLLDSISSTELIALAGLSAIMISQGLDQDEIATFASFFSAFGDNLGIIASNNALHNT